MKQIEREAQEIMTGRNKNGDDDSCGSLLCTMLAMAMTMTMAIAASITGPTYRFDLMAWTVVDLEQLNRTAKK